MIDLIKKHSDNEVYIEVEATNRKDVFSIEDINSMISESEKQISVLKEWVADLNKLLAEAGNLGVKSMAELAKDAKAQDAEAKE